MTHAIIYDRASTKLQEDNFSRVNAKEIGIRIAEQHGFIWEYIKEIGSGTTLTGRPKMVAILDRIAAGEVQALIVQDLDRLARPVERASYEIIRNFCFTNGVRIYTHSGQVIDFADDDSDFFADLQMAFAKKERQRMLKRSNRSKKARAEAGKFVGGSIAVGYSIVGHKASADLVIDPDGAEIVKAVFNVVEANFGNLTAAARELNSLGYTGAKGRPFRTNSVRWIVTNQLYIGIFESKVTDKVTHRPDLQIISVSQFEQVQLLIKSRIGNNKDMGRRGHYVLTGFIGCPTCGGVMVGANSKTHVSYQCQNRRFKRGCSTGKVYTEHLILPPIIEFLADLIQNKIDFRNKLADTAAQFGKTVAEEALEERYNGELASIRASKERLINAIAQGVVSTQEAAVIMEDYREQEQKTMIQLASIAEKTALQADWQKALSALDGKDVREVLTRLAQDEPLAFRRILSLVFEPNSIRVYTERKGRWCGVLISWELTQVMQDEMVSFEIGQSDC